MTTVSRHSLMLALATALLVGVLAASIIGLIGLLDNRDEVPPGDVGATATPPTVEPLSPDGMPQATRDASSSSPAPTRLDDSRDPATYATALTVALLTWDTTLGPGPLDHAQPVLLDGDPTGAEMAGLLRDVTGHLPSDVQWAILRRAETRQTVTVHDTTVPSTWPTAYAAAAAELPAGTTAVTVHATRHRSGRWNDEPVSSDHPIAFTVFMACPPPNRPCHVLRLSRPDQPMP